MRVLNGPPLNDDSSVYVCRNSRFSSSRRVTGPLLYRNVLLPRLSMVLNVYRKTASGLGVAVAVDLDVVGRVGGERVEVRAAVGLLERHPVGDERDVVGSLGADERVQVRVVDRRIGRDQRRLPVAGRECRAWPEPVQAGRYDRAGREQPGCPFPWGDVHSDSFRPPSARPRVPGRGPSGVDGCSDRNRAWLGGCRIAGTDPSGRRRLRGH
jgi:hypothetical protein